MYYTGIQVRYYKGKNVENEQFFSIKYSIIKISKVRKQRVKKKSYIFITKLKCKKTKYMLILLDLIFESNVLMSGYFFYQTMIYLSSYCLIIENFK